MEWTYSLSCGALISPSGESWNARSGPFGAGALPAGLYTIGRATRFMGSRSYRDRAGNTWWCPITPRFSTSRHGLGIHPDGGTPGTEGCIGLTAYDTSSALRALNSASGDTLTVLP